MSKKMLFVFNPHSGKAQIKNRLLDIIDIFVKDGWTVEVHPTQSKGDACDIVGRRGARFDTVVVSGGDGTLNECIHGLMQTAEEKRPRLGYIPAGTTNDFASNLKIPKDMIKAAKNITGGNIFKCDIGRFNDKNFSYVAAFGAFTDVAYDTPQQNKNVLGQLAYFLEGIKRLHTLKSEHITVEYDGVKTEGEFIFGMAANTNYLAGFKTDKAIRAELNDGLFEVVLIKRPQNAIEFQDILAHLLTQDLTTDAFCVFRAEKVRFSSEEGVSWTLDGEYGGDFKCAEVSVEREAISFVLN